MSEAAITERKQYWLDLIEAAETFDGREACAPSKHRRVNRSCCLRM